MLSKKKLTPAEAVQKARAYCAYQERSHSEVREKLYSFGLLKSEVESIITTLIEENYLNEERFATQFAGGKFRMKHWGRTKIRYELQKKKISAYCIKKALAEIDETEYVATLEKLVQNKLNQLPGLTPQERRLKLQQYLLQKGYEAGLIGEILIKLKIQN